LYQRNINEQNNVDTTLTANVETTLLLTLYQRWNNVGMLSGYPLSGGSNNFEKGGRQFISPVLIYRKCTQRSI